MNGSNWIRPVILAVSCLILGFVGGWTLASVGGDTVDLPDASLDVTVGDTTAATDGTPTGAQTGTGEQPAGTDTGTATGGETPDAPPARDTVNVAVLNGSGVNGKAGETATTLKGLGYTTVQTGNAATRSGDVVYYRADAKPAADQVAADLRIAEVSPIEGAAIASSAPAAAQVIIVLGT